MTPEEVTWAVEFLVEITEDSPSSVGMLGESVGRALHYWPEGEDLRLSMKQVLKAVWDDGRLAIVYGASEWHRFASWDELEAAFDAEWQRQDGEPEVGTLLTFMNPEHVPARPQDAGEPRLFMPPRPPDYSTDEGDYYLMDTLIGPRILGPYERD